MHMLGAGFGPWPSVRLVREQGTDTDIVTNTEVLVSLALRRLCPARLAGARGSFRA